MTSPDSPSLSTEKRFHCNRCGKDVLEGAHTCLKRPIVETYRSESRNPAIQNLAEAPALSEGEPPPDLIARGANPDYSPQREIDMWKGHLDVAETKLKAAYAEIDRLSAPSLSTSSPPELHELLDDLVRLEEALGIATQKNDIVQARKLRDKADAARSAIELSFATLTEDSKRLEWMIEHGAFVADFNDAAEDGEPWECSWKEYGKSLAPRHRYAFAGTPRKAIDAARSLSGETPK